MKILFHNFHYYIDNLCERNYNQVNNQTYTELENFSLV